MHSYAHLEDKKLEETSNFVVQLNIRSELEFCDNNFIAYRNICKDIYESDAIDSYFQKFGEYYFYFSYEKSFPEGCLRRRLDLTNASVSEVLFDLEAFNSEHGTIYSWVGFIPNIFNFPFGFLVLSNTGTGSTRYCEFNCEKGEIVQNGFDLEAYRATVCWLDSERILISMPEESPTATGWGSKAKILKKGENYADKQVIFEIELKASHMFFQSLPGENGPIVFAYVFCELGQCCVYLVSVDGVSFHRVLDRCSAAGASSTRLAYVSKNKTGLSDGCLAIKSLSNFDALESDLLLFETTDRHILDRFVVGEQFVVWSTYDNLKPRLHVYFFDNTSSKAVEVTLPDGAEAVNVYSLIDGPVTLLSEVIVVTEGITQPQTFYLLHGNSKAVDLDELYSNNVLFKSDGLFSELYYAPSEDGESIPYRIVGNRDIFDGKNGKETPLLLHVYGGFSVSNYPVYNGTLGKLWLEKGNAFVLAHVRGGGEFGPLWHSAAVRENKFKSADDLAAIVKDVCERKFSSPSRIGCRGISNGGLTIGMFINKYPNLISAAWMTVPVFDIVRFAHFDGGRAWISEYGNPDIEEDANYLLSFSPMHNVRPASDVKYPAVYIECNSNDERVHPSHSRRMAAVLLENGQNVWFNEFSVGGHFGDWSTGPRANRMAFGYRFLAKTIC